MKEKFIIIILFCVVITVYGQRDDGGTKAPIGQYPYQAAIRKGNKFICGASIISRRCFLTAAHCVSNKKSSKIFTVTVGTNKAYDKGEASYPVSKIIRHEDFEKYHVHANDIALLRINQKIMYNKRVKPIKLPYDDLHDYEGVTAVLAGWGTLNGSHTAAEDLQHVKLRVINQETCVEEWKVERDREILDSQICTVAKNDKNIVTPGDSGGPLVYKGVQIGVGSFAWHDLPDVFTRVASYLSWIKKYNCTDD